MENVAQVLVRYFEPTSLTCLVEPWLRELGFSIFYGSILIKLYRILTEFQTRKAHRVCFRDKDQVVYLLAIVLIVVGYMSAWTALMVDGFLFAGQGNASAGLANDHNGHSSTLSSASVIFPTATTATAATNLQRIERASNNGSLAADPLPEVARYLRWSSSSLELSPLLAANQPADQQGAASTSGQLSSSSSRMVSQLAEYAPEQLRIFARNLDSFGELFSGLLEQGELKYDESSESFVAAVRCRKLTWDYVTELSK